MAVRKEKNVDIYGDELGKKLRNFCIDKIVGSSLLKLQTGMGKNDAIIIARWRGVIMRLRQRGQHIGRLY